MRARKEIVDDLVRLSGPLSAMKRELRMYPWDCDAPLAELTKAHVVGVLRRYLNGELAESDVESWADALEGREDVRLESSAAQVLSEMMFELANPEITAPLSFESAQRWIRRLEVG